MRKLSISLIIIAGLCMTSCISINETNTSFQNEISSKKYEEKKGVSADFKLIQGDPWKIKLTYKQHYIKVADVQYEIGDQVIRTWDSQDTCIGTTYRTSEFASALFKTDEIPGSCVVVFFPFFTIDFLRSIDSTNYYGKIDKKIVVEGSSRFEEKVINSGNIEIEASRRIIIPISQDGTITITDEIISDLISQSILDRIELYYPDLQLSQIVYIDSHPLVLKRVAENIKFQDELDKYTISESDSLAKFNSYDKILNSLLRKNKDKIKRSMIKGKMIQNMNIMIEKWTKEIVKYKTSSEFLSYYITGSYKEIDKNVIEIVGKLRMAYPLDNNWNHEGAVTDGNIIVYISNIDFKPNGYGLYNYQYNYFIKKSYGQTLSGERVPVWYYTTKKPASVIEIERKIKAFEENIEEFKNRIKVLSSLDDK